MSQPSRTRAHGPAKRRRQLKPDMPIPLEERCLLAPFISLFPESATFTAATTPTNAFLGTVTITSTTTGTIHTAAPITSVTELTPLNSFGGDIVRIKAGVTGVDTGVGTAQLGATKVDYTASLSENPSFAPTVDQPFEAAGIQHVAQGLVLAGPDAGGVGHGRRADP